MQILRYSEVITAKVKQHSSLNYLYDARATALPNSHHFFTLSHGDTQRGLRYMVIERKRRKDAGSSRG